MDRNECKMLGQEIDAAIRAIVTSHGLAVRGGVSGRYDPSDGGGVTYKIVLEALAPEGLDYNPNSKEAKDFVAYTFQHGLPAEALGSTFSARGKEYRIVGYRPRATKQPIICAEVGAPDRLTIWTEAAVQGLYKAAS